MNMGKGPAASSRRGSMTIRGSVGVFADEPEAHTHVMRNIRVALTQGLEHAQGCPSGTNEIPSAVDELAAIMVDRPAVED